MRIASILCKLNAVYNSNHPKPNSPPHPPLPDSDLHLWANSLSPNSMLPHTCTHSLRQEEKAVAQLSLKSARQTMLFTKIPCPGMHFTQERKSDRYWSHKKKQQPKAKCLAARAVCRADRLALFEMLMIKANLGFLRISPVFPPKPPSTHCVCAQQGQILYKRNVTGKNSMW